MADTQFIQLIQEDHGNLLIKGWKYYLKYEDMTKSCSVYMLRVELKPTKRELSIGQQNYY